MHLLFLPKITSFKYAICYKFKNCVLHLSIMSVKSDEYFLIIRDSECISSRYENHSFASVMRNNPPRTSCSEFEMLGTRADARELKSAFIRCIVRRHFTG